MQVEREPLFSLACAEGVIRPMQQEDVLHVMEIESAIHEFPWTESIFRDCIRVNYSCWVIEAPGVERGPEGEHRKTSLWGYGLLSISGQEAHILNLVIRSEQQKKGLGAKLLRHLFGVAQERGAEVICLEVRVSNMAAISLYQRLGFKQTGEKKDYYPAPFGQREDALLFTRDLFPGELG